MRKLSGSILDQGLTPKEMDALNGGCELDNLWACHADPRFSYFIYIPEDVYSSPDDSFHAVVLVHGTTRETDSYRHDYQQWAKEKHLAIIVPQFPAGMIDPDDFNDYKLIRQYGIQYDNILLAMLTEINERFPAVNIKKFFLAGHSGGGQFTHRFFYLHPERLIGVCISAPGRITYLDPNTDFYWGTKNFKEIFGCEPDYEALKQVPVHLLVGELDTDHVGYTPYGNNRMERIKTLLKNYQEHGISADLQILPGVKHADGETDRARATMKFFDTLLK